MFAKRITTFFVFTALLFAPSILAKPMPAAPSGLAARASHKHAQTVGHSTKLMSTYKGHHVRAAKRAAKAKSVAYLLQSRQDADIDDAALAVANTAGDDAANVEDAEAGAVDGEEATPTRRQDAEVDDTTEPAAEDTTEAATDGATGVENSIATTQGDVADAEDAALKRRQDVTEVDSIEDVSGDAADTEESIVGIEGDAVNTKEATLEERQEFGSPAVSLPEAAPSAASTIANPFLGNAAASEEGNLIGGLLNAGLANEFADDTSNILNKEAAGLKKVKTSSDNVVDTQSSDFRNGIPLVAGETSDQSSNIGVVAADLTRSQLSSF